MKEPTPSQWEKVVCDVCETANFDYVSKGLGLSQLLC